MERASVASAIREYVTGLGASTSVADAIIRSLAPAIRLIPRDESTEAQSIAPLGSSRIGGLPLLPAGHAWPRVRRPKEGARPRNGVAYEPDELVEEVPLGFLLQINLAEVSAFDVGQHLPADGLLSFFFEWDSDWYPGCESVIFVADPTVPLVIASPPADLPECNRYRSSSLTACVEWTVPSPPDFDTGELEWQELEEHVARVQSLPIEPRHRMFGYPNFIQSPGLADGTALLLQVDSDKARGMLWGDCGLVYYLVEDAQLSARHFGAASVFGECC